MMKAPRLKIRDGCPPLSWGHPDSPQRELCSVCHGKLPDVPLMMWTREGFMLQFCDACVDKWITTE